MKKGNFKKVEAIIKEKKKILTYVALILAIVLALLVLTAGNFQSNPDSLKKVDVGGKSFEISSQYEMVSYYVNKKHEYEAATFIKSGTRDYLKITVYKDGRYEFLRLENNSLKSGMDYNTSIIK